MKIDSRTFLISGGSSGLGLATALHLLTHNANVSILDLQPPPSSTTFHASLSDPQRTLFTHTDITSSESLHNAVQATLRWVRETGRPLGGVVCCAGVGTPAKALPRQRNSSEERGDGDGEAKYMDMKLFDRVLAINLRGTVDLIRLCLPHLARNEPEGFDGESGVCVVVSSIAAYEGQVGQVAYSASKGAVASLVLPLAREVGREAGIRVMGIAPGVFETAMTSTPKPKTAAKSTSDSGAGQEQNQKKSQDISSRSGAQSGMVEYPMRMGRAEEFARMVKEIVENPMLNGGVIRLDGGARFPSRL